MRLHAGILWSGRPATRMKSTTTLWQEANAAAARRDWPTAIECFDAAAARAPGEAAAWIALAKAHDIGGSHRASRDAALRAAACSPAQWTHALALARLLRRHHEVRVLDALARSMAPRFIGAHVDQLVELADLCSQLDLHAVCRTLLEAALARDAEYAPAHYLHGTSLMFEGRMSEAAQAFEHAIALAPHFAHAHWRLSELHRHLPEGAERRVARMRTELARAAPGSEHAIHLLFALHAELHDLGDHAAAWQALAEGCLAKRASLAYDPAATTRLFDALRAGCDAAFLAGPGHAPPDDAPVPVFIVGLFRSGTTVLERLLGGHPQVSAGGETLAFTTALRLAADDGGRELMDLRLLQRALALDHEALGAAFMAASSWRAHGRRVWSEKLPSNFINLGLIARALPRARFVHVQRAPVDVCFSNLRVLYGGLCPYSYDQRELAAYHRDYARLMAHWHAVLGERLLAVSHASLIAAPERELRRVAAHCGLEFDAAMLRLDRAQAPVSTYSATQVRTGLRQDDRAWLRYREHLGPLLDALGESTHASTP
jgi:tetratricopeptide (TPR) repeat protein